MIGQKLGAPAAVGGESPAPRGANSFINPLLLGADPWVTQHAGWYWLCLAEGDTITLRRGACLTRWEAPRVIWRAPRSGLCSKEIWAPELHRLGDRWYLYLAASDGRNKNHRIWVLQSQGDDPRGPYENRGPLYTGDHPAGERQNRWAIDGTVLHHGGDRYLIWSGWPGKEDVQYLYIARMKNPWTLSSRRVRLCHNADHLWERVGETHNQRGLHEGPQVLQRDGRVWLIYSCSASWLPGYKLGMLELKSQGDPLASGDWIKRERPVFESTATTFGVGHGSFATSPNGREDWLVYHAKVDRAAGWRRAIFAQPFDWTDQGEPNFGQPVATAQVLRAPATHDDEPRWAA